MGYSSSGSLEEFGRVEPMRAAQRRTVERVGDRLLNRTRELTPVAKPPPGVELAEWMRARKGRAPGTLKASWRVGTAILEADGTTYSIAVFTHDEIAPHVEWPTMPHIILPRKPGGWLRFWDKFGGTVYALVVHHPGTRGSFMLTTALAEVALEWQQIGREEMDRWASEQMALVA